MTEETRGIIQVITGDGRGKSTSAFGTAMRAAGYGHKVLILQFIKGDWNYGEEWAIERLSPEITMEKCGIGFYKIMGDERPEELHKKAAAEGIAKAEEAFAKGEYNLLILDEINNAVHDGLVEVEKLKDVLSKKPAHVHVILSGRNAHSEIIEVADMVSEVKDVKHPFTKGIYAQKGFDY